MGGMAAVQTLYLGLKVFDNLIILDSLLRPPAVKKLRERATQATGPTGFLPTVPTRGAARPATNTNPPCTWSHVAEHSLRRGEGGWTWQFDTTIAAWTARGLKPCLAAAFSCEPTHRARAPDVQRQIVETVEAPDDLRHSDAGHHMMFGVPRAGHRRAGDAARIRDFARRLFWLDHARACLRYRPCNYQDVLYSQGFGTARVRMNLISGLVEVGARHDGRRAGRHHLPGPAGRVQGAALTYHER